MDHCIVCGKKAILYLEHDRYICRNCLIKAGGGNALFLKMRKMTTKEIISLVEGDNPVGCASDASCRSNTMDTSVFEATRYFGNALYLDNDHRMVKIPIPNEVNNIIDLFNKSKNIKGAFFAYEDIAGVDLLEDGETITSGGLGSAALGGALFGGAGAITGAIVGKKRSSLFVKSLQIKLTVQDKNHPVEYIELLDHSVGKNSTAYRQAFETGQEIISALSLIIEENKNQVSSETTSVSIADELSKLFELKKAGVLTNEEFEQAKAKLLK